jgi:hypothetical protein
MTEARRPSDTAPWIVAGALAAVAAAMVIVLFVMIVPHRNKHHYGLTATQQRAVGAASQTVVNLLTYTRTNFDADYSRALAGMTGALRSDQQKDKAATLAAMTKGKFDLKGTVTASAFEQAKGKTVLVLVSATGNQVSSAGTTPATTARFEMTMTLIKGKWLASNLQSIGLP